MKKLSFFIFSILLLNSSFPCLGSENDSSIDDLENYISDSSTKKNTINTHDDKISPKQKFLLGISYKEFLEKYANKSIEEIEEYFDDIEKKKEIEKNN